MFITQLLWARMRNGARVVGAFIAFLDWYQYRLTVAWVRKNFIYIYVEYISPKHLFLLKCRS